jgi:hypothetical protein
MHPTVRVAHPSGRRIPIDVELAPVIATLWAWGVRTASCCQGPHPDGDYALVRFVAQDDVAAFRSIVPVSRAWRWDYIWVEIPRSELPALVDRLRRQG